MATAILITNSSQLISDVEEALDDQLKELSRRELAEDALRNRGKVVLLDNLDDALDLANKILASLGPRARVYLLSLRTSYYERYQRVAAPSHTEIDYLPGSRSNGSIS